MDNEIGGLMSILLVLNLIYPFVMILVGHILKKDPVSDMNTRNGYNTSVSRRSQAHWDYAQSIAPDIFMLYGKVLLIIEVILSAILFLLKISIYVSITIGMCIGLLCLILGFYKTNSKIKEKFAEK